MRSRVLACLLVLSVSAGLAGCYKSRIGVIERGEQAPVAGTFNCRYSDRDGGFSVVMTERRSGKGRYAAYRYLDPDGRSYKLARLQTGLYLVQTGNEGGDYEYGFVDFTAGSGFSVLDPDSAAQWSALKTRALEAGIRARLDDSVVTLRGRPDRLRAFFAGQDRALLRESSRCLPG
jgi:hypothetical protein